jgi:Concanavalin A-like lectin/glucanases superfamily
MKKLSNLLLALIIFSCSQKVTDVAPVVKPPVVSPDASVKGFSATTPTSTIQLKPNAFMVKNDINSKLLEKTKTSITYQNSTETNAIKEGEVLYSLPTDKATDGYALVVVKKTLQGDKIIFETRPATMEEVFVKMKDEQIFKPNFKENKPVFYDPMDIANRGGKVAAGGTLLSLDRIKKFELTESTISIDYIFYDSDGKFNTTSDQILASLKLDHTLTNTTVEYDGDFTISGEHKYSISAAATYEVSTGLTDKFVETVQADFKRQIIGKKIRLFSVPLPINNPAAAFVVQSSLDFYLTLELDAEGKFKAFISYNDFGYKFNYRSGANGVKTASGLDNSKGDIGLEATAKGKFRVGLGTGMVLKFPAFEYDKEGSSSYIGLFNEYGIGGEINVGGTLTKQNFACTKLSINPEIGTEVFLEAKLGVYKTLINEQRFSIYKPQVLKLSTKEWDSCKELPGDIKTGLVAYYPFNGNANDESGNKLNAVSFSATLTDDRNGIANKAYALDGKSYLRAVTISTTAPVLTTKLSDTTNIMNQIKRNITLATWINLDKKQSGTFTIFNKYYDKSLNPEGKYVGQTVFPHFTLSIEPFGSILITNNNCFSTALIPQGNTTGFESFPRDSWVHIAVVQSGEIVKFYLNGTLIATKNAEKNCFKNGSVETSPLFIGGKDIYSNSLGNYGKIDEAYIFNRALTDNDVKTLYLSKN